MAGWRRTWLGGGAHGWVEAHVAGWRRTWLGGGARGWVEAHVAGWRRTAAQVGIDMFKQVAKHNNRWPWPCHKTLLSRTWLGGGARGWVEADSGSSKY
jgi:hypothetical protein